MTLAFLVCGVITVASALVSLGFSLAALINAFGQARVPALYAMARSFALSGLAVAALAMGSTAWMTAAASAMIVVQICDAAIGASIRNRLKTVGPAATALANFAALVWLLINILAK